jgi:hypothetical protein
MLRGQVTMDGKDLQAAGGSFLAVEPNAAPQAVTA